MDIHVATVDPDSTLAALDYAVDMADVTSGEITVVHVVSPPEREVIDAEDSWTEDTRSERLVQQSVTGSDLTAVEGASRTLERAAAHADELGLEVDSELLFGDPLTAIPSFADAAGASIVVVERPTSEWADGDPRRFVDALVDRSPVPVVIVPP